jgi:hypothetical protein
LSRIEAVWRIIFFLIGRLKTTTIIGSIVVEGYRGSRWWSHWLHGERLGTHRVMDSGKAAMPHHRACAVLRILMVPDAPVLAGSN